MLIIKNRLNIIFWFILCIFLGLFILSGPISIKTETPSQSESAETLQKTKSLMVEDINKLEKTVSKLRNLPFKNPVKVGIKTKKELRQKLLESYKKEEQSKEYVKIQKALIKFGLIPKEFDLNKLMIDLLTEQIAGFYDPKTKELYVIMQENSSEVYSEIARFGVPYYNITAVHELTHALQDQHYDLRSLPMDNMINDDIATAVQALVEGEATYVMYDYFMRRMGRDIALIPNITGNTDVSAYSDSDLLSSIPTYIREGLLFPYNQGLRFVHRIKSEKGWGAIDDMYKRLPASTEQILHPAKYIDAIPDYPITVRLPDLSEFFPSKQYDLLLKNVVGEFTLYILVKEFLPNIKSKRIAAGWDGDQYIILEKKSVPLSTEQQDKIKVVINQLKANGYSDRERVHPERLHRERAEEELLKMGTSVIPFLKEAKATTQNPEIRMRIRHLLEIVYDENTILIWFTTWDTAKDAQEFYDAYFRLVAKKYADLEIISQLESKEIKKTIWLCRENLILLERRERDVLVIETVSEKILPELKSLIWKEVEKEELKEVKRIDPEKKKSTEN